MAEAYHMDEDKVKEMIGDFEQRSIKEDIRVKKALDLAVENAIEK